MYPPGTQCLPLWASLLYLLHPLSPHRIKQSPIKSGRGQNPVEQMIVFVLMWVKGALPQRLLAACVSACLLGCLELWLGDLRNMETLYMYFFIWPFQLNLQAVIGFFVM